MSTLWTAVPKTAINEHGQIMFIEVEVRFSIDVAWVQLPALDTGTY